MSLAFHADLDRSRAGTPVRYEGPADAVPEAVICNPPISRNATKPRREPSKTPNTHLKVLESRKRKTRSSSPSPAKSDTSAVSKTKKQEDSVSPGDVDKKAAVLPPAAGISQTPTPSPEAETKPRSSRRRLNRKASNSLDGPDLDDQIVLQKLTADRRVCSPSAVSNPGSSVCAATGPDQEARGAETENNVSEDKMESNVPSCKALSSLIRSYN